MRLTEEDKKVLELVERWGFMSVEDICNAMKYKNKNSAVWRLNRLVKNEIMRREKSIYGFYLYVSLDFKKIDIATFKHNQTAKNLALYLSETMQCNYITLRELRSAAKIEYGTAGLTKKVPDFMLTKDEKKIAVEVELTQKNLSRQMVNIDRHIENLSKKKYIQVYYYCSSAAINERIVKIIQGKNIQQYIKTSLLPGGILYE